MKMRDARMRMGKSIVAVAAVCLAAGAANALPASERNTTYSPEDSMSPVVLFFEPGSSAIPSSARPIANRALAEGVREWRRHLRVDPYVAADGGAEAKALAEERAHNLVAFLIASGIPQWRVAPGSVRVAELLDPAFGLAGERVEIHFRPGNDPIVADMR